MIGQKFIDYNNIMHKYESKHDLELEAQVFCSKYVQLVVHYFHLAPRSVWSFRRVGDPLAQEHNLQADPSHRLEVCRDTPHLVNENCHLFINRVWCMLLTGKLLEFSCPVIYLRVGNLQVLPEDNRRVGNLLGVEDRAPHQGSRVQALLEDPHFQGSLTVGNPALQGNLGSLQQKEGPHQDNHQGILALRCRDHLGLEDKQYKS